MNKGVFYDSHVSEDQTMSKTIITTVTCRQCGKQFTAGKYTRFCPDCRKIRALAHQRGV